MKANMSLYEMNRQIISQIDFSLLTDEEIKNIISTWCQNNKSKYYLLYGKEMGYFTFFEQEILSNEKIEEVVLDCLKNIGNIYSVSVTENNTAVEIWVEWKEKDSVTCLYLFDFTQGVVYFS